MDYGGDSKDLQWSIGSILHMLEWVLGFFFLNNPWHGFSFSSDHWLLSWDDARSRFSYLKLVTDVWFKD